MPASALVSVEEYLNTIYHPDCDYVDGRVVERNLGELDHSDLQGEVVVYFRLRRKQWGVHAFLELRVQVSPTRFRIPDVCVTVGAKPTEQILRTPPFRFWQSRSCQRKIENGTFWRELPTTWHFGVRYVWVIDPRSKEGWVHTTAGVEQVKDGILRTQDPALEMSLPEIFASIEER